MPSLRLAVVLLCLCGIVTATRADAPTKERVRPGAGEIKKQGSQREEAVSAIPLEKLSPEQRARIAPLLEKGSIHQRLSSEVLRCDAQLYQFLVDHPDVMVAIWETLGISRFRVRSLEDDEYEVTDQRWLKGTMSFLQRSDELRLVWFESEYRGPLSVRPVTASGLFLLRSAFVRETDQHLYVVHRLDVFLKLDSPADSWLMQLMDPLASSQANRNFSQIGSFLSMMSMLATQHPEWTARLIDRLTGITPLDREEFHQLAQRLARPPGQRQALGRAAVIDKGAAEMRKEPPAQPQNRAAGGQNDASPAARQP